MVQWLDDDPMTQSLHDNIHQFLCDIDDIHRRPAVEVLLHLFFRQCLALDFLFAGAFDQMHRNSGGLAVFQMDFRLFEALQFIARKETHPVYERKAAAGASAASAFDTNT